MSVEGMNHFTILSDDLEATRKFYCDMLGFKVGKRPPFNFPGWWLYVGETPILHVIGREKLGEVRAGVIDHMAFSATDLPGTVTKLKKAGIEYDLRRVAGGGVWQLFFFDPHGARVEFDFPADETAPEGHRA
jgi:catechol 2,3-dioxygenase-like lactoylglutathione lyase family enzyme